MFHKMINLARDRWYASDDCTIGRLIEYIQRTDKLRDAQLEAIKTYLFLKIGCGNKSLAFLFQQGFFNSLNPNDIDLSSSARVFLEKNTAAAALLEYALLENDYGVQLSPMLAEQIKKVPESIDYARFFEDVFYGVSYTDYLFSLPMGAGKTYLMAAFVYLDLYFASNEPENPAFAHNFIIFAPSGLKSSVIPGLRTIQRFNPSWVLPEPSATEIKRKIIFEVLDQSKAAKKSNKAKNPNVQKIANHQPFDELFGLVAVTNAEKVILDRIQEKDGQVVFGDDDKDNKDRTANELRDLIGKLPSLSIFIDEVHHAVSSEIKLRAVVNKWSENRNINSVIGFSGTPYLEKSEKVNVTGSLSVTSAEISNVVYYYPLIGGIGNFLKRPTVKISDAADSARIVEDGIRAFLEAYRDTVYEGGLAAKLGIYCGTIEKLEQAVYPIASRVAAEYGMPPDVILKFHKGNKQYPQPTDSQFQFDILDRAISRARIVLLVQIGKEGWDCRSLTGIILSQEGDCPRNMVLQTSCRCLRQVVKGVPENALIYLNEGNAAKLNAQLLQQHHISLKEFAAANNPETIIKRYDRTEYLKLPPIQFYQLKISYDEVIVEEASPPAAIARAARDAETAYTVKTQQDFEATVTDIAVADKERGAACAAFVPWLYHIAKYSFGFISIERLKTHAGVLRDVFDEITYERNGEKFYSSRYDRALIESNIRKAFYDKRAFSAKDEMIPQEARLLNIVNFTDAVRTNSPDDYYPNQVAAENIILEDRGEFTVPDKESALIESLESSGYSEMAETIREKYASHPARDRSFHYIPYKIGSGFEETFLSEVLALEDIKRLGLEVYYNGDRSLTDFRIRCYRFSGGRWHYIGMYTPDFLIIQRRDGEIYKAVIAETKGEAFAANFAEKRDFIANHFVDLNKKAFGYDRFDFLYLEDTITDKERILKTHKALCNFFEEDSANA